MKIILTAALIAVGAVTAMTSVPSPAKAQGTFYNYDGDGGGGGYRRGPWNGDDEDYRPRRPRGPGYPCAGEGGFCNARPGALILFGAGNNFARRRNPGGGIPCTNRAFGYDPYPGVRKACYVRY